MSQSQEVQSTGKVIKMSDIIRLLKEEGKSRKEINAIYGETDAAMKIKVWSHPDLKGIKTVKIPNIELVDDREKIGDVSTNADEVVTIYTPTAEIVENVVEETTQEAPVEEAVQVEETQEVLDPAVQTEGTQRGTW